MDTIWNPSMSTTELGRHAYDAYCESSGGVSLISGAKLPNFDGLSIPIKNAWVQVAVGVIKFLGIAEKVLYPKPVGAE